jgi:hypothetical protein
MRRVVRGLHWQMRMSLLARLLGRLGYVKLSDFGLTLAEGGRVVYAYPRPTQRPNFVASAPAPFSVPPPPGYVADRPDGTARITPRKNHKTQMLWRTEKPPRAPAPGPASAGDRTQILELKDLLDCRGRNEHDE